jgi:hypothetical protein
MRAKACGRDGGGADGWDKDGRLLGRCRMLREDGWRGTEVRRDE